MAEKCDDSYRCHLDTIGNAKGDMKEQTQYNERKWKTLITYGRDFQGKYFIIINTKLYSISYHLYLLKIIYDSSWYQNQDRKNALVGYLVDENYFETISSFVKYQNKLVCCDGLDSKEKFVEFALEINRPAIYKSWKPKSGKYEHTNQTNTRTSKETLSSATKVDQCWLDKHKWEC